MSDLSERVINQLLTKNANLEFEVERQKRIINEAIDKLYCWGETLNPVFQQEMLGILKDCKEKEKRR